MEPEQFEMLRLAKAWGFSETEPMSALRQKIIAALQAGHPVDELWQQYIDASESGNIRPNDIILFRLRAGRHIQMGLAYLAAGEIQLGLSCLYRAEAFATQQGHVFEAEKIVAFLRNFGTKDDQDLARALSKNTP